MFTTPMLREPRSRKALIAVSLVLALLATMLAFSAASPAAGDEPDPKVCYGTQTYTETKYVIDEVKVKEYRWFHSFTFERIWAETDPGLFWLPFRGQSRWKTIQEADSDWFENDPGAPWEATEQTRQQERQVEVACGGTAVDPSVVYSEKCEVRDELYVPETEGVTYWFDGGEVNGETLYGPLAGALTAVAKDGYELTNPEWSYEFDLADGRPCPSETWGFPVEKELVDDDELVSPGIPFEVSISCAVEEGAPYEDSALIEAGQTVYFTGIPLGAAPCTVTETAPDGGLPGGYTWNSPSYAPDAEVGMVDTDGGCAFVDYVQIYYSQNLQLREVEAPCVTITNSYSPPPPPSIPDDDPEPEAPTVDASVEYSCDADGTVNLSSDGGSSDFVIEVNGSVVYDETLIGGTAVDITVDGATSVVVTADGEEIFSDEVEFEDCPTTTTEDTTTTIDDGDVGGIVDEGTGSGGAVGGGGAAAGGGTLPRTGAGTGGLLLIAGLILGLGGVLRTASRRLV